MWVEGEISNLRTPSSGHAYFTLKDDAAQLRCVLFRGRGRRVRFELEDGMQVLAFGGLDVYANRGEYQLVVELLEPKGLGALQIAFEQLKRRLEAEGLFDAGTQAPAAAVSAHHRHRHVAHRRGASATCSRHRPPLRRPARADRARARAGRGGAAGDRRARIADLCEIADLDVVIVGRGGGSIEDLWAFNDERVARAIARCRVPVISAVGHETDFTIADFVADLRAPDAVGRRRAGGAGEAARGSRARASSTPGSGRPCAARSSAAGARRSRLARRRVLTDPARALREWHRRVDDLGAAAARAACAATTGSPLIASRWRQTP